MGEISIKFDDVEFKTKLKALSVGVKNYKKPLKLISKDLLKIYSKDVFKTKGKAIGEKWAPLSAATLKMRKARTGHYKKRPTAGKSTLIWTGKLKSGFESSVGKTRLVIKNTVDYFKTHQLGRGKIPKRRMLAINKNITKIVIKRVNQYIITLMKK